MVLSLILDYPEVMWSFTRYLMPLIISATAEAIEPGFYGSFGDDLDPFQRVSDAIAKADHQIDYRWDDTIDIGIGEVRNGTHFVKGFPLRELGYYFKKQRHKALVSVLFHKGTPRDRTVEEVIAELEEFFFSRGYQRILFLGARGSGIQVYKDTLRENFQKR